MSAVSKLKRGVSCIVFFSLPFFVYISQMATGWVKTPKSGIANGGVYCNILSFPCCYCGPVLSFGLRYSLDSVIPLVILHAGFEWTREDNMGG